MRTAKVYRINARNLKDEIELKNYLPGEQVQFELVQFTDGTIAQRWLTYPENEKRSTAVWQNLEALKSIHIYPHPDYGTRIEWSDGEIEEL